MSKNTDAILVFVKLPPVTGSLVGLPPRTPAWPACLPPNIFFFNKMCSRTGKKIWLQASKQQLLWWIMLQVCRSGHAPFFWEKNWWNNYLEIRPRKLAPTDLTIHVKIQRLPLSTLNLYAMNYEIMINTQYYIIEMKANEWHSYYLLKQIKNTLFSTTLLTIIGTCFLPSCVVTNLPMELLQIIIHTPLARYYLSRTSN